MIHARIAPCRWSGSTSSLIRDITASSDQSACRGHMTDLSIVCVIPANASALNRFEQTKFHYEFGAGRRLRHDAAYGIDWQRLSARRDPRCGKGDWIGLSPRRPMRFKSASKPRSCGTFELSASPRRCGATASVAALRRCPRISCCSGSRMSSRPPHPTRPLRKREARRHAARHRQVSSQLCARPAQLPRIEIVCDPTTRPAPAALARFTRSARTARSGSISFPAQLRVLATRRPRYACRACEDVVVQ